MGSGHRGRDFKAAPALQQKHDAPAAQLLRQAPQARRQSMVRARAQLKPAQGVPPVRVVARADEDDVGGKAYRSGGDHLVKRRQDALVTAVPCEQAREINW